MISNWILWLAKSYPTGKILGLTKSSQDSGGGTMDVYRRF